MQLDHVKDECQDTARTCSTELSRTADQTDIHSSCFQHTFVLTIFCPLLNAIPIILFVTL